jgi:hypothetical protein
MKLFTTYSKSLFIAHDEKIHITIDILDKSNIEIIVGELIKRDDNQGGGSAKVNSHKVRLKDLNAYRLYSFFEPWCELRKKEERKLIEEECERERIAERNSHFEDLVDDLILRDEPVAVEELKDQYDNRFNDDDLRDLIQYLIDRDHIYKYKLSVQSFKDWRGDVIKDISPNIYHISIQLKGIKWMRQSILIP